MRIRIFVAVSVLFLFGCLLALTACGQPLSTPDEAEPGEEPSPGATVAPTATRAIGEGSLGLLSVYITDEFSSRLEEWVDDFNTKNPGAQVMLDIKTDAELAEFLSSAEQLSGVMLIPADYLASLDARGLLNTDLPVSVKEELFEGFFYSVLEADTQRADGTPLGLPYYGAVQGIWYRKDLFEEAGLEPPNTPENVLKAAESLHDPDASLYGIALPTVVDEDGALIHHALENLARAGGAQPLAGDGSVQFGDTAFAEALQLYADLVQYRPPEGTTMENARVLFLEEQLAMILDSTALPQELKNRSTDVKRDEMARKMGFVAAVNDTAGDGSATYAYTMAIAVGSDANEGTARVLIGYLMDDAYNVYWIPQGWGPAVRGFAMQWRALKGHDWFGYYEAGMPEDLLDGFRKAVRWSDSDDMAALTCSRIYTARLFPSVIEQLLGGQADAAGAAEWLQGEADSLQ
jgi:multiple sugar transport system substrate-binding protein